MPPVVVLPSRLLRVSPYPSPWIDEALAEVVERGSGDASAGDILGPNGCLDALRGIADGGLIVDRGQRTEPTVPRDVAAVVRLGRDQGACIVGTDVADVSTC